MNLDNLILFNVGGLSNFEISSLEKANKNKQFNINLIYGSNQIYNHEEYIQYIKAYFKGNNGIVKEKNNVNNIRKFSDEDDDSKEIINIETENKLLDNEAKQHKINVGSSNVKNSLATMDYAKSSSIKDSMNFDIGPMKSSNINIRSQDIRIPADSDDFATDLK